MIRYHLKRLMDEKGVSYRQLSKAAKVSTSTLNNMIQENPRPVQTDALDRICDYLECHLYDLVIYEPDVPTPDGE